MLGSIGTCLNSGRPAQKDEQPLGLETQFAEERKRHYSEEGTAFANPVTITLRCIEIRILLI